METVLNNKLFIYDCCLGKLRASDCDFMTMGAAPQNTFRLHMSEPRGGAFALRGDKCRFYPNGHIRDFSLNGKIYHEDCDIAINTLHLMVLGKGCFLLWLGKEDERPDFSPFDPGNWYIYNKATAEWAGPFALEDLADMPDKQDAPLLATFPGLVGQAFYLHDIQGVAKYAAESSIAVSPSRSSVPASSHNTAEQTILTPAEDATVAGGKSAELTCPHCQHKFVASEILAIAAHHDLRGDDILGHNAMRRFVPISFNARGIPMDECGAACPETACPACHTHLPPFFKQTTQHIVPLVGAPSSGKTYYLLSLIHELESELPRLFNTSFRDADPTGNSILTHLMRQIFSAKTTHQAYVGSTSSNGKFYHRIWRNGEFQDSPRPLIFNVNKNTQNHSLVLYDCEGNTFQPGNTLSESSRKTLLQSPSGCMFLYDPCADDAFCRLLAEADARPTAQQEVPQSSMLSELELQLRMYQNTPLGSKMSLPLAVIIGKADLWQHLLGPEPLLPTIHNGKLISEHIATNSRRIRQFLFGINPSLCTNAEAMADEVRYFAVSSLGSSPSKFRDAETGEILYAPAPGELRPRGVTAPLLWVLSHCAQAPISAT